jgi:hypothetical protein
MRNAAFANFMFVLVVCAVCCTFSFPSFATNQWTFEILADRYGQVAFGDGDNQIFALQCTRHSGVQVSSIAPDQSIKGGRATLTLSSSNRKITVRGILEFDKEARKVGFLSDTIEDDALVDRILGMIASGTPITILLGRGQYNIPAAQLPELVKNYTCI